MVILVTGANGQISNEMQIVAKKLAISISLLMYAMVMRS